MNQLPFQQVDVFSAIPFRGNPVAVVLDGNDLSTEQMQAIANWTNLSETTFVCEPTDQQADYRLRIFTPRIELPFAGHPSIGSAHAVLRHVSKLRNKGCLVQQCNKGLVSLHIDGERLFLALPMPIMHNIPAAQLAELTTALGIIPNSVHTSAIIDVGVAWITLQLADADMVRCIQPDLVRIAALTPPGVAGLTVFGLASAETQSQIEVRSFAPAAGIPEDSVCGSGNGCVATLVKQERLIKKPTYIASQGCCLGRNGRVEVRFNEDDTIWLGGHSVTCVEGMLHT
jgi:PhzF family phenazine biosynthesis protein